MQAGAVRTRKERKAFLLLEETEGAEVMEYSVSWKPTWLLSKSALREGEETTGRSWPGVQKELSRKSHMGFKEEFHKGMLKMIWCQLEQGREGPASAVFGAQPLTSPLRSLVAISFSLSEGRFEVWGHSPCSYLTSCLESLRLTVIKTVRCSTLLQQDWKVRANTNSSFGLFLFFWCPPSTVADTKGKEGCVAFNPPE